MNHRPSARGGASTALVLTVVLVLIAAGPASAASSRVVTSGNPHSRAVALTFDDGTSRSACARITRILRDRDAKGTFFVNGVNLARAPAAWRRILQGQPVANHTLSHQDLTRVSNRVVKKQIRRNETIHERILGRRMLKVLRPPWGTYDTRTRDIAGRLGYRWTVLWNVDTLDWSPRATRSGIISRATGAPPGSIILMHCSRQVTADALPAIIRHYRSRGIKLLGLERVLGI